MLINYCLNRLYISILQNCGEMAIPFTALQLDCEDFCLESVTSEEWLRVGQP